MKHLPLGRSALQIAAIGGVSLLVLSSWRPELFPVALLFGVGHVAIAFVGAVVPQLQVHGNVRFRGDSTHRWVAITFDDGPHPTTTLRVLELLAEFGVTATFFVLGEKAERNVATLREIAAAGHEIGLHGQTHDRLLSFRSPQSIADDLRMAKATVERITGESPRWFRPPLGHVSPRTVRGASLAGMKLVAWSARGLDGLRSAKPERVARRISRNLVPGAIVQMHDAAERDDRTPAAIDALPRVLRELKTRGLEAVSISTLLTDKAQSDR